MVLSQKDLNKETREAIHKDFRKKIADPVEGHKILYSAILGKLDGK